MKRINKSAIPSLIFAVLFLVLEIIRFDKNNLVDSIFYFIAIIGFIIMFFIANKR